MEGKIITCCGDCVYYDWKKHKCKNGYSKEDNPQSHFYDDCNVFESLEEHDKEVYNMAIDDFVKECICYEHLTFEQEHIERIQVIAEQLKVGGSNGTDNQ